MLTVPGVLMTTTLLAGGCDRSYPPPGQVMLAVSSNLVPGRDFTVISVEVLDDIAARAGESTYLEERVITQGAGDLQLPLTAVISGNLEGETKSKEAWVRVKLLRGNDAITGQALLVRDVRFALPDEREERMVHISLDWLSMLKEPVAGANLVNELAPFTDPGDCNSTNDLAPNTRNAKGECVISTASEAIDDPDFNLQTLDLTQVFGGGAGLESADARCFNAEACFESAQTVAIDKAGCTVQIPAGLDTATLNIAINTVSDTKHCPAGGCGDAMPADTSGPGDPVARRGVVLDAEVFRLSDRTLTLPARICNELLTQDVEDGNEIVFLSSACNEQKSRTLPLCGNERIAGRINARNTVKP